MGDHRSHPSYPRALPCPLVSCSLLPGMAMWPAAQIGMCLSRWTLWGLESSLAGRTKAWPDSQAQNARAKVKKSDRHCSVYEQQGACLCPLWPQPSPPTCWPSGLGGTRHGAVTMARDQCVGRGHCPCLGMDLRIFGRGPVHPALNWVGGVLLSHMALDSPSSCPTPRSPSEFPGPFLAVSEQWVLGT